MPEELIDECRAVFAPLRVAFEHGAKVAAKEKTYTAEETCLLPTTSAVHFGTDEPSILPDRRRNSERQPPTQAKHEHVVRNGIQCRVVDELHAGRDGKFPGQLIAPEEFRCDLVV